METSPTATRRQHRRLSPSLCKTSPNSPRLSVTDKVQPLRTLVRNMTLQIDDLKLENELLKNKAEMLLKERSVPLRDSYKVECDSLKRRNSALSDQMTEQRRQLLQLQHLSLVGAAPSLLHKAQRYCDFLQQNISHFPVLDRLLQDRAGGVTVFSSLLSANDYSSALLVSLQVLCDLLVLHSHENSAIDGDFQEDISEFPLSPIESPSSRPSFAAKVENEYEEMLLESRKLTERIDLQSRRIAALSQQMGNLPLRRQEHAFSERVDVTE